MLIFDLDGTLLNTAKDLENALNYALRTHGFPEKDETETLALLGNGIDALVAGALPQERQNPEFEKVFATFKNYYSAHLNDYTAPYPGIIPLLQELQKRGIKMGIVSNKFDEGVKALAAKFFGRLVGHAQGVLARDARSGHGNRAAVRIVHAAVVQRVSWGFRSRRFLRQIGAATIIDTPEELLALI